VRSQLGAWLLTWSSDFVLTLNFFYPEPPLRAVAYINEFSCNDLPVLLFIAFYQLQ